MYCVMCVQTTDVIPSAPSLTDDVTSTPSSCPYCHCSCQHHAHDVWGGIGEPPPSYADSQHDHALDLDHAAAVYPPTRDVTA